MAIFEDLRSGKVKLEFGNLEQISAIKRHLEMLEHAEKNCLRCDGEGMITCPVCYGSGERSIKKTR